MINAALLGDEDPMAAPAQPPANPPPSAGPAAPAPGVAPAAPNLRKPFAITIENQAAEIAVLLEQRQAAQA